MYMHSEVIATWIVEKNRSGKETLPPPAGSQLATARRDSPYHKEMCEERWWNRSEPPVSFYYTCTVPQVRWNDVLSSSSMRSEGRKREREGRRRERSCMWRTCNRQFRLTAAEATDWADPRVHWSTGYEILSAVILSCRCCCQNRPRFSLSLSLSLSLSFCRPSLRKNAMCESCMLYIPSSLLSLSLPEN